METVSVGRSNNWNDNDQCSKNAQHFAFHVNTRKFWLKNTDCAFRRHNFWALSITMFNLVFYYMYRYHWRTQCNHSFLLTIIILYYCHYYYLQVCLNISHVRLHRRLNVEPLEEVDCFKYLGRKWLRMEVVKWMWHTEWTWGLEREEHWKVCRTR